LLIICYLTNALEELTILLPAPQYVNIFLTR